jgi:AraC-like DNA-binding protein/quercetin dioxygenase-like cupin family protein
MLNSGTLLTMTGPIPGRTLLADPEEIHSLQGQGMQRSPTAKFELVPKCDQESFNVREFKLPAFASPWHFHPETELTYIVNGTGSRFVGDSIAPFGPGDLVLIGADLPHVWRNDAPAKARADHAHSVVVHFNDESFGAGFFDCPEFHQVRKLLARARRGIEFGPRTSAAAKILLLEMKGLDGLPRLIRLLEIFELLANAGNPKPLSSPGFSPELDWYAGERINAAHQYIFQNFTGRIDHKEMARNAAMSASAFSRYFRRLSGRTVSETVNEVRVGHARRMLIETDRTITEVAYASGFESLSNFNRRFRDISGISPREYRQRHLGA